MLEVKKVKEKLDVAKQGCLNSVNVQTTLKIKKTREKGDVAKQGCLNSVKIESK